MALPRSIAIDGPGASGKSAVGRRLADVLGYQYFDTGALYRALAVLALGQGVSHEDGSGLAELVPRHDIRVEPSASVATGYAVFADGRDVTQELRRPEVEQIVSAVSSHPAVRRALLAPQRRASREFPVVMAGRDIGTVVLPDADLKIYLDASIDVRAARRAAEQRARGEAGDLADVREALARRDESDSRREAGPLSRAADAVVVNTDDCGIEEVVAHLVALVRRWPDALTTEGGEAPCRAGQGVA